MPISFKHFCDDKKINSLIEEFGVTGYYIYFRTVEFFATNKNTPIILDDEEDKNSLVSFLVCVDYKVAKKVYDYIQGKMGLFENSLYKRDILQIKDPKTQKSPKNIEDAIKDKEKVAEYVYLNEHQIKEFTTKYGKIFYDRCIELLSNYKANSGGTVRYNDDAAAIRNWVVDRVSKEKAFFNYKYPFEQQNTIKKIAPPKFKGHDSQSKNY